MKTDRERLLELLNDFGVVPDQDDDRYLILSPSQDNVVGYCGFYCSFEFNKDGKFIEVEIGE